ncbi:hypothetical protein BSKO_11886 [Bryopsis sp. KO-2023]|nr:hypothetical protein BSKO_11886 [Bryopsis sp. KO-2023]
MTTRAVGQCGVLVRRQTTGLALGKPSAVSRNENSQLRKPSVVAVPFKAANRVSVSKPCCPPLKAASDDFIQPDEGFSITKVSYGSIMAPLGVGLLVYGFGGYFELLPGGEVSSLLLIYGFPLMLLGFALKYAELKPVECKTTGAALALRETQMTDIQKQVREDVTRYRYGDEQHLEEALERIFKFGRSGGIPRRLSPKLTGLREEVREGMYTLVLEFGSSLGDEQWSMREEKFKTFFGPGITAEITSNEGAAEVALICDGSGDGISGEDKKDVLPPLLPGLSPRQQD